MNAINNHFATQYGLPLNEYDDYINVDLFAGGGGASTGLEMGLERPVHIAINHNPAAISMHQANHPGCLHLETDVWDVDPAEVLAGRKIGWFHASPDCTHHSQAAGGQPRKTEIRNLSWVVTKWAGKTRPLVMSLENVKQIRQWGPLIAKRCKKTGRVMKLDGSVADPGERVPRNEQYLVPDKKRRGKTWRRFLRTLQRLGYDVDHQLLKACDYGAPTSRERLFMVCRSDDQPIEWPEVSHAAKPKKGQKPYRTAAECIDWSIPGQSIFSRKRSLADATMRRIAKGIKREVIDRAEPFLVPIANWSQETVHPVDQPLNTITAWPKGGSFAVANAAVVPVTHQGSDRMHSLSDPMRTITAASRGELALASASLVKFRFNSAGGPIDEPLPTITSGGNCKRPAGAAHAMGVATAFLAQANGGFNTTHSKPLDGPMTTITNTGSQQQLVAAHLLHLRGNCDARAVDDPLQTISARGQHHAHVTAFLSRQFGASVGQAADEPAPTITAGGGGKTSLVELKLSPEAEEGALRCAAFLMRYYSEGGQWGELDEPLDTVTTKDRLALVTVWIKGDPYVIVDICLRMLQPHELYAAQGFPSNYIITHGHDGRKFTKSEQVHMCGNSVSPPPMAAIARANNPYRVELKQEVAA
ncbi:DNA cytosine methyltransferase [Marinobacterium lutimaris]|uniref:DNA (cytosine-5-)-methyltransferase n=1 Tax=Marinobacterium lutimaris TaxID=568106 RepID=A0A1H5YDD8_9GAMM|nr:DNA cytosine methyltransferase [Marinobacterium lutimaris]SEG21650.1 DNA (cytosine-5)-methyltransferase 1 [Marinobacterium lutimaris]